MSDESNTAVTQPPKKSAQDHYADFIGNQASKRSLFDTRDTKPTGRDDIAKSIGKGDGPR